MAYDDEKREKERREIKKKIKEKKEKKQKEKEKRDKLEKQNKKYGEEVTKLEKENKKLTEDVKNYEILMTADKSAQSFLKQANTNISSSETSYKNNLQGKAGEAKASRYTDAISKIEKIHTSLGSIYTDASIAKKKCEAKIKENTAKIKDYNLKISDNNNLIKAYNRKISDLNHEIRRLEDKL